VAADVVECTGDAGDTLPSLQTIDLTSERT
jgi:hypothetical protein